MAREELQKIGVAVDDVLLPIREKRDDVEIRHYEKDHEHEHGRLFGDKTELIFAATSGGLLLIGWLMSLSGLTSWGPWILYVAAYFFGGYFTVREAIENVRAGRFEIDSLMLIAAVGAATLGEWSEGALLLFLFSLGHSLEHYAMGRAKRAIEALAELSPQSVIVRRDGQTKEVPVEQLRVGDIVVVKPNERLPADGFVVKGQGSVNQAPITGECVPVDKRTVDDAQTAATKPEQLEPQYRAFAGTINGSGALEIQVTRLAIESMLARVVQMVNEAKVRHSWWCSTRSAC